MTDPTDTLPESYQSGKIKTCPFCGGEVIIDYCIGRPFINHRFDQFREYCPLYFIRLGPFQCTEDAIKKWNRRVNE